MQTDNESQNLKRRLLKQLLPNPGTLVIVLLLLWVQNIGAAPWLAPAAIPGSATTINYQGRLFNSSGQPVNSSVNLSFSLYDQASGGILKWGPETHNGVVVNDGLFSVLLGSQMAISSSALGGDLWLETKVNGETLSPREQLGAVPIAMTVPDGAITSRMLNPTSGRVAPSADLNLTDSLQDISGATLQINVPVPSTVFLVASVDYQLTPGSTAIIELWQDGAPVQLGQSGQPTRIVAGTPVGSNNGWRGSASNNYVFNLAPGTHTLQLKARLAWGTGGAIRHPHTGFSYIIFANTQ